MHKRRVFTAHARDHIVKYQRPLAVDLDFYNLLIREAELLSILRREVDMAFCDNNPFGDIDFTLGTDQLAAGAAGHVAALTDRRGESESRRVCERQFDLIRLAARADY